MLPFNVMTYLPSFYFGGVIAWIGQDILKASLASWVGGIYLLGELQACRLHSQLHDAVCRAVQWEARAQLLSFASCFLPSQDWLFIAAKRVSAVEYCLLLATFGLVMAFGLEAGIAGGIVLAALHFAYRWAGGWLWLWGRMGCECAASTTL